MIKAGIIGSTGYAGGELVRILTGHKDVEIKWFGSRSYIDKKYADVYRNMFQIVDAVCLDDNMEQLADQVDVIFTATPQGLCASLVNEEILSKVKIIDKAVHEAAKILDIEHLLDRKPKALSGGQRQRVAMGRAIVREPKVFLMDEPLSNLDAKLRVQMRVEISKLHQKLKCTIIYVTHDQTEAMTLGTRIVVLKDGIIQQVDTPQALYNTPQNLFVAGFIGSPQMNLLDAKVVENAGAVTLELGANFSIKLPEAKGKKLIEQGYVGKTVVAGIRPEDIHDEELFLTSSPDSIIEATIKVYELLGAEVNLHFDLDDVTCTAKVNPRTTARPGDTVKFAIDLSKLHIFDKETEQVICH